MDDISQKRDSFMELPRGILVRSGALEESVDVLRRLHLAGKGVIVCDDITEGIAGRRLAEILEDAGFPTETARIKGATESCVGRTRDIVKETGGDFLLGVGGGRPIDVAKYVATMTDLDFVSVPTAASHDGIASNRSSIEMDGVKKTVLAKAPLGVIADTEIIAKAPHRLLASGCADIISNCTAVLDWRLARRLKGEVISEYAAALSEMTARLILENAEQIRPNLEESARMVVKALFSSSVAMSIAGSSRLASGAEHMFSHALDSISEKPALHGEECGVGTIMMMYLHGGDWRRIRKAIETIGAPVDARSLGVGEDEIVKALVSAVEIRPERYTILGPGLDRDAARDIAVKTGVIH